MKCLRFIPILLTTFTALGHPLNVHNVKQLDNLPSASASSYIDGLLYTVGDDSPSLYALDPSFKIINALDIGNGEAQENGRITGELKADLEAAQVFEVDGKTVLVFMGSGTQTDTRERALRYTLEQETLVWQDIRPLYRHLRTVAKLKEMNLLILKAWQPLPQSRLTRPQFNIHV